MQRLEGLRNSFGTRQSIVRKKFGVRLRERRTKAEILAERERMGIGAGNTGSATKRTRASDYNPYHSESPDVDDVLDQRKRKTPSYAYSPRSGAVLFPDSKYLRTSDSRGPSSTVTVVRGSTPAGAAAKPASTPAEDDNMSDSSSDDDDDIPALLPDDVRQSLSNR